jgi:hypothetical protein
VKEQFPDAHTKITTHPNKSYCECLLLSTFLNAYRTELEQFDYTIKISGRYFFDHSFDTLLFNKYNADKIFYKLPISIEWSDSWNYDAVDMRMEQGNNVLNRYCSVLFGWGRKHNSKFRDMFAGISAMLTQPSMNNMDIETLGYYFTRPYAADIIETDWIVYGWDGTSGRFLRY